jgi:hypothetical protein
VSDPYTVSVAVPDEHAASTAKLTDVSGRGRQKAGWTVA